MNIELPQLLPECLEPAHQFCSTCRSKTEGRDFRKAILSIRKLDDRIQVDFNCPIGKPWLEESGGEINLENKEKIRIVFSELLKNEVKEGKFKWEEGDLLNNVEHLISRSIGDPNSWILIIRDALSYYEKDFNIYIPLNTYISLEMKEEKAYLKVDLSNSRYGIEECVFESYLFFPIYNNSEFNSGDASAYILG